MAIQLRTPPNSEPVSLAEGKEYLRLTDTDNDALVDAILQAVRERAEEWLSRALVTQTWVLWQDRIAGRGWTDFLDDAWTDRPRSVPEIPGRALSLPRPPLVSVNFIKTYDKANIGTVFDAANYFVDTVSAPGRIVLNEGAVWPTGLRPANAVEIEFVAGYGAASDVPGPIRQGILLWTKLLFADKSKLFEADESTPALLEMNRLPIPPQVQTMWQPYRRVQL